MVTHIVSWNLQEEAKENRDEVLGKVKKSLEDLKGIVPEIVTIEVKINLMSSGTVDAVLISTFNTVDDLDAYQENEDHLKAASYIKSVFCNRTCIDYEI